MASSKESAFALAATISDHKGIDVRVLDVGRQAGWTDFFVIATGGSSAHLRGLSRFAEEEARRLGLERLGGCGRPAKNGEEEWLLIDFGDVLLHLMSAQARAFYELEKLWFQAETFTIGGER